MRSVTLLLHARSLQLRWDNLDRSPDLAMLLALEAYRRVDDRSSEGSYEARNSLVSTLTRHPRLKAVLRVDDDAAAAVTFGSDGSRLAAGRATTVRRRFPRSASSTVAIPQLVCTSVSPSGVNRRSPSKGAV